MTDLYNPYAIPQFRGYASGPPTGLYNPGNYNVGDWFEIIAAASGYPCGWACIASGGPDPCNISATCGTWRTMDIIGDT